MTRRAIAALAVSFSGLGLAWVLTPMSGPPLYDGLILGNDPYRYVSAPPGHRATPPPSSAAMTVKVSGGLLAPFTVGTHERPPQAQVSASTRAFRATGSHTAQVTITPIRPDHPAPRGDVYDGNVYQVSVSAGGKELTQLPGATVIAALRGTGAKGQPLFALRTAKGWSLAKPTATGTPGVYSRQVRTVGEMVLVIPAGEAGSSEGGFPVGPVVAVVVFMLLLGGLLVVVRVRHGSGGAS
jgi:hypothetical protein